MSFKKTRILFLMVLGAAWVCNAQQKGAAIIEKIDAFRTPYTEFRILTRITTYKNSKTDETALFDAYINGTEKSLVVQKKGKNRGMKILYSNEKLWIQLPAARRPIRITPIQRLMGQASNGDVARLNYGSDYDAVEVRREMCDSVQCRVIELSARKKSATYHKILLWARDADLRPVKAEFFLVSGRQVKTAVYESYMTVSGRSIVQRMKIFDTIHLNRKTIFDYEEIEEKRIPEKYYNKNYLVHVRGL